MRAMNINPRMRSIITTMLAPLFTIALWAGSETHRLAPSMPQKGGNGIFSSGALPLAWFVARLRVSPRLEPQALPAGADPARG